MVADNYKEYMHGLIRTVIEKIGPRETCSEREKELGRMMAREWAPICDQVATEKFTCSPTAYLGFLPFMVLFYLGAAVFYWLFPPLAMIFGLIAFSMLFFEFMRYKEFVDFLWPRREGENVLGIINPKGEIKRRVIVCGHLDSAYEFNLWLFLGNFAVPVMIIGVLAGIFMVAGTTARAAAWFTGSDQGRIFYVIGVVIIALYPLVGLFIFFHSYTPVPGAMDDMAGVAVAAGVGKCLGAARAGEGFFPLNTQVVLFGAAAEEGGLRGAKRYVRKHLRELREIPTHAVILDGVYDEKFLTVITRELCTGAKHDPGLVKMITDAAGRRSWPIGRRIIPLGGTDASAFSLAGISSTAILCQDIARLVPNYHTRFDTPEKVRPESLAVCLQIVLDVIQTVDEKG